MPEIQATVGNELGLHARAAASFVRLSTQFESEIFISCREIEVDGKSIMGVMMLAASPGSVLGIRAEGNDAQKAVDQLAALVKNHFGEEN